MRGGIDKLIELEKELLHHLGYDINNILLSTYKELTDKFNVSELETEHEMKLKDESLTYFITHFPESTSPFWNMKRNSDGTSNKIDVILSGHETIGSAERETDKNIMLNTFSTIMNGEYKNKLY
jgi:aspartyl/asparaginyl-tRNA synthetase